jgi:Ser/Thr protein kinase RdoA (MazF antagonist)
MQPYHTLSNRGKLRRLRQLAQLGLSHYEIQDPQLTYHGFETNLLYRVTTARGEYFMLRLAYPGWRTLLDLQSEALWINALSRDTDIPVPKIKPANSGDLVLDIASPDVPDHWYMTLMQWVPGRLLGYHLTEHNLKKMGRLFAELHIHGAAWQPPANFTQRRFEHWLSRGEPDLISGLGLSQGNNPQGNRMVELTPTKQSWIQSMAQQVEVAYQMGDRADLRVIHCDLWHDNIKLNQGVLHPFDFEDTVWGYCAHDIAMAMLDLLEIVGEAHYPRLLGAFQRGYEALLSWPEAPIEPFQIGRMLWMINWVARHEPEHLLNMIERYVPVFGHFERTGMVILPKSGSVD